jgi:uncharacterized protein (DUF885 family)
MPNRSAVALLSALVVLWCAGRYPGQGANPAAPRPAPQTQGGKEVKNPNAGDKKEQPSKSQPAAKDVAVPDLRELIVLPQSELLEVVRRYEADRASLLRRYPILLSATRQARLQRFERDWRAALRKLAPEKLSKAGRADLATLQKAIEQHQGELERQARERAEIAPLIPFAPAIVSLEETRHQLEQVEPARAADLLTGITRQIDQTRLAVEAGRKGENQAAGLRVSRELAGRAAGAVRSLRATLRNWFGFYNGYDPLFTWWMAEPYRELDEALQRYADCLRRPVDGQPAKGEARPRVKEEQPRPAPAAAAQRTADESNVPDLNELMAAPRSELRAVIQRYQTDRRRLGGFASARVPLPLRLSAEGLARRAAFDGAWLAALQKLDFDRLSPDGRIDYLLLKNYLQREVNRRGLHARARGRGRAAQPVGREALLVELAGEMIAYTPEELLAIARKELAWCEAELKKAAGQMGFGDDWRKALEKVKALHVAPGRQPQLIRDLAREAIAYVGKHDLVTVPPLARETWRMEMMSPQRQLINPFFTGGEVISVSFPTSTMSHQAKRQSMRGNNIPFARATVHHELIPGHHLQGFMTARYRAHRRLFRTAFWTEGWAVYWELLLYDRGFPRSPEDRVGMLFWRMHRCARILFTLEYHLGKKTAPECIDFLVKQVGHEPDNAAAEVRRSFGGGYGTLYQCAYLVGALQMWALHRELVGSRKMTERAFHDAVLKENCIPIALVRARLTGQALTRDYSPRWKFSGGN